MLWDNQTYANMHIYICSCSSTARSYALRMRVCMCICTYIYNVIYSVYNIYNYIYIYTVYIHVRMHRQTHLPVTTWYGDKHNVSSQTLWNGASRKMSHTSVSASGHWHGFLLKITAQLFPVPANLEHLNISVTCSSGSKHSLQIIVIFVWKTMPSSFTFDGKHWTVAVGLDMLQVPSRVHLWVQLGGVMFAPH